MGAIPVININPVPCIRYIERPVSVNRDPAGRSINRGKFSLEIPKLVKHLDTVITFIGYEYFEVISIVSGGNTKSSFKLSVPGSTGSKVVERGAVLIEHAHPVRSD